MVDNTSNDKLTNTYFDFLKRKKHNYGISL
jgi:hypothetical protein